MPSSFFEIRHISALPRFLLTGMCQDQTWVSQQLSWNEKPSQEGLPAHTPNDLAHYQDACLKSVSPQENLQTVRNFNYTPL